MKGIFMGEYKKYKEIRNLLRQSNNKEFLMFLIGKIHSEPHKNMPRHWLLILFKWLLANYEESNMKNTKDNNNIFGRVLKKYKEFDALCEEKVPINSPYKIIGRWLYQQYWLQIKLRTEDLARSYFLFSRVGEDKNLNALIRQKTSLTSLEFYQLSFLVWAQFHCQPIKSTSLNDFEKIAPDLKEKLKLYFSELSLTLLEAKNFSCKSFLYQRDPSKSILENDQEKEKMNQSFYLQIYERSPFIVKPFISIDDKYWWLCCKK